MLTSMTILPIPTDVPAAPDPRRRTQRYPHVVEAWISSPTAKDPTERIEVESMDLSRHGVGFESDQPVPPGTFFIMEIGVGSQRLISEIRVAYCRPIDSGRYHVGAEFC